MKKLRCIIVDDEPVARKILREFAGKIPYLELQAQYESAEKAHSFLKNNDSDLVFLDIEMPGLSGIEFLQGMEPRPLAILTTAFPQYALAGYELDIIDYLLKPFAFSRFQKAVQKAWEFRQMKEAVTPGAAKTFIFVRSDRRIEKIELRDILYIESLGNYAGIYTESRKIMAYLTLKSLENQLPSMEFVKIHQSYLVNFSRITAIEGNELRIDEQALPIGRNYKETVMTIVQQRLLKR
jgi:DNA-binding LytR/AlgR family response regulator